MQRDRYPDVELRRWASGDHPLLVRLMGDPAMTGHLGGPESPAKLRERHERYCRLDDPVKGQMFVIVVGPERVAAGSIGYWEREQQGQAVWEVGWSVLPAFQGRGIASRATAAVVARVRAVGTHRFVHAYPAIDNAPSNAICRKAGFTLAGAYNFEYPPGNLMRCSDWYLDLFADESQERQGNLRTGCSG